MGETWGIRGNIEMERPEAELCVVVSGHSVSTLVVVWVHVPLQKQMLSESFRNDCLELVLVAPGQKNSLILKVLATFTQDAQRQICAKTF